jgi:hypothetical protein
MELFMGIFQKIKFKRLVRKACKANENLEVSKQLATNSWECVNRIEDKHEVRKIEHEKTYRKYNEIKDNLDLIPWYRLVKRTNAKHLLQAKEQELYSMENEIEQIKDELNGAKKWAAISDKSVVNHSEYARYKGNLAEAEYISQELYQSPNINTLEKWLSNPPLICGACMLNERRDILPKTKGIYAWYFACEGLDVPNKSYFSVDGFDLLYIGIAGKKPEGKGNLRSRIGSQHITGNAEGSSLRFNLGILLHRKGHPLMLKRKGLKRIEWSDENYLTDWICNNAVVAWLEHKRPALVEKLAVENFGHLLPLNYEHNENNTFAQNLKNERSEMRSKIRKQK